MHKGASHIGGGLLALSVVILKLRRSGLVEDHAAREQVVLGRQTGLRRQSSRPLQEVQVHVDR